VTFSPGDRLGLSVFLALVAHAAFIFGVSFAPDERPRSRVDTLDIVLVRHAAKKAPDAPDYLAQANQAGGGSKERKSRPSTPVPAPLAGPRPALSAAAPPLRNAPKVRLAPAAAPPKPPRPAVKKPPAPKPLAPPAAAPKPVIAQKKRHTKRKMVRAPAAKRKRKPHLKASTLARSPSKPAAAPRVKAKAAPPPTAPAIPTRTLTAAALISRSLAMASLDAEIDRKLNAYAKRPRQKWITARTRAYKYAAYMEAWRAKVERVGNLNYPDEARRRKLSGNLLLDVALKPDGSIHDIELRRSSGKRVLDDAAIRIVKLSAPFARFPKSIAREVDILHIQRTWRFLSDARFSGR